jgi:hypothetical protein
VTPSYTGLVNGDTAPATVPTCVNSAHTSSPYSAVGSYPTSCSSASDPNYTITYQTGTLTITPASLTISADNKSEVYGNAPPAFTASYAGFVNGDTSASLSTKPSCTSTAHTSSPYSGVGSYPITCSGAVDPNYTITYPTGTLTITPASLTITASSPTVTYGDPAPTITAGYSGFITGDNATNSLSMAPTCSTAYTPGSGVSGSPYKSSCSGAVSTNYSIGYVDGTVSVAKKTLTVTAPSSTVTYGQPAPTSLTPTITGFVLGQGSSVIGDSTGESPPTCSTTYVQGSDVAHSPYPVTCSGGSDDNYGFTYLDGKITVVPQQAPVAYIGQTAFVTSGSSSTTAQVALSASLQDATGDTGNVGTASLTFTDLLSGKVLASGVKVTPVSNTNVTQGTANTIVTLSTGQYGAQQYLIQVSVDKGNYQNCQQTGQYTPPGGTLQCSGWTVDPSSTQYAAAHPTVTVMIQPTTYSMQGVAALPVISTAAGSFGDAISASYAIGMQYNSKGTNPQGQIQLVLERPASASYPAGTYYIKSHSITSLAFANASITGQPSKDVTIYTKASIYSVNSSGTMTSIDGNVTLRVDAHEGCTTSPNCSGTGGDMIGFTVLSSKTGALYYSNNWVYNSAVAGWSTVEASVPTPYNAVVIN